MDCGFFQIQVLKTYVKDGDSLFDSNVFILSLQHSILERYKRGEAGNLLELHNKTPVWNDETQSYVLNFHGRVTQVHRDIAITLIF